MAVAVVVGAIAVVMRTVMAMGVSIAFVSVAGLMSVRLLVSVRGNSVSVRLLVSVAGLVSVRLMA